MSFATILWGALTGTWFGSQKLAALPWLSWMIVPALSSFNPRSGETFKIIFFTVGAVHISIAHFWSFLRQASDKPFIRSLAQLGWLIHGFGTVLPGVEPGDQQREISRARCTPSG